MTLESEHARDEFDDRITIEPSCESLNDRTSFQEAQSLWMSVGALVAHFSNPDMECHNGCCQSDLMSEMSEISADLEFSTLDGRSTQVTRQ